MDEYLGSFEKVSLLTEQEFTAIAESGRKEA